MAFCVKCGKELAEGAAFCSACGAAVNAPANEERGRRTFYDGEIHKCPNCGEILKSFETNCSSCGYELRGIKSVASIKEFSEQLQMIEQQRNQERFGDILKQKFLRRDKVSAVDRQKINLINSFPIPNAKEDIREFMIVASTHKKQEEKRNTDVGRELYNAWDTKLQQMIQKTVLSFGNDIDYLKKIMLILDKNDRKKLKKLIAKTKKQNIFKWGL